eukprot:s2139_g4.t1
MTDAEPSIRALAEAASKEWGKECQIQVAPRESHTSNGAAERAILELAKQARTVTSALEHHFPGYKVDRQQSQEPHATPGLPAPGTPAGSKRGIYITVSLQLKYGQAPDCPGCYTTIDNPRPRSKVCRDRFEKLVVKEKEEAGTPGSPAVPELEARDPVERAAGSTAAPGAGSTAPQSAGRTAPKDVGRTAPMDVQSGGQSLSSGLKRDGGDQPQGESTTASSKRLRGEEQRGERRPAETDLEALEYDTLHAALLDPEPEIIAGQPTLHETPPIAHLANSMPNRIPRLGQL